MSVLLTGDGKSKTRSAFGMVMRVLGYGQKVGVVQFIKGAKASGEENFVRDHLSGADLHKIGIGFTRYKTVRATSPQPSAPGNMPR